MLGARSYAIQDVFHLVMHIKPVSRIVVRLTSAKSHVSPQFVIVERRDATRSRPKSHRSISSISPLRPGPGRPMSSRGMLGVSPPSTGRLAVGHSRYTAPRRR